MVLDCSQDGSRKLKKGLKRKKGAEPQVQEQHEQQHGREKENARNGEAPHPKKTKKRSPLEPASRPPLSPRPPAARSTSAAALRATVSTLNAQLTRPRPVSPPPRPSLGDLAAQASSYLTAHSASPSSDTGSREACAPSVATSSAEASPRPRVGLATPCAAVSTGRSSAAVRLELSTRMAREAERLQAEAQQEEERAAQAVQALNPPAAPAGSEEAAVAEELRSVVQRLAQQMEELQATKQQQQQGERRQAQQATTLRQELRGCQAASEALRRQVATLQDQLRSIQEHHAEVEQELVHQRQVNRRLSQRLSGCFTDAGDGDALEDPLAAHALDPRTPQPRLAPLGPPSPGPSPGPLQLQTPCPPPSVPAPQEPPVVWPRVPTVTPSRGTAPAIYNEPKNAAKKQEYAASLDEQIAEQREMRRQQQAQEREAVGEYFPYGRPGSGAPVRDANSNVVTNVTFCRSRRPIPIDHPSGPLHAKRSASQESFAPRKKP